MNYKWNLFADVSCQKMRRVNHTRNQKIKNQFHNVIYVKLSKEIQKMKTRNKMA
jgi:hypothetical protein